MKKFNKGFIEIVAITALALSLLAATGVAYLNNKKSSPPLIAGSFTPVGTTQFTLSGSGVTSSASTIQLNSFLLPDGKTPISMSMLGSIGYGVIEPNNPIKIEDITFTGVTQNANGTAILTGVSRGMSFYSPYQASTTLAYSHSGGSYFILSNTAGFYGQQFALLNNTSTFGTLQIFQDPPIFINAATSTNQAASVAYVNSVVAAGCANSSETVNGCSQLSTGAQAANGTSVGSTNGRLVLPSSLATSTPTVTATNNIPVTVAGKLSQLFLDLTQAFTWTGNHIFNGTLTANATTTIAASSVTNNALVLNGLAYKFPSTRAASSTVLSENGSGSLTFEPQSAGAVSTSTTYSMPTSQGSSVSTTVYCVSPKIVASGGVSGLTANSSLGANWDAITASYPSATNAWTVTDKCTVNSNSGGTCGGGTATVYAICVNP